MKKAIKARLAKDIDKMSIKNGMPSLVLMERAAYEVARESLSVLKEKATTNATKLCDMKALVVCGVGNNGADGLACARMLNEEGVKVEVLIVGDEGKATKEYEVQKNLIDVLLIPYFYKKDIRTFADKEYNIIIDAIFGIGLTRDVSGEFGEVIDAINSCKNYVISVDIPSGIDSDCGKIRAHAIRADKTVTFGYKKLGHMLYPGREYSGEVVVKNIGFMPLPELFDNKDEFVSYIDDFSLPVRERRTNKGSFGKPLIIAGSKDMTGAAFMSGMAAYKSGSGVVSVLTHESCDEYVKSILPEAIVKKYSDDDTYNEVKGFLKGASIIVLGPGLSTSDTAKKVVDCVLANAEVPLIIDADALNIIAGDETLLTKIKVPFIITPHIGEMARLTNKSIGNIIDNIVDTAKEYSLRTGAIVVLKDAVTVVSAPDGRCFLSTKGNPGMATAGSGDVLTGIMAAVCDLKIDDLFEKVCLAVHIHGLSGDVSAARLGETSVMARDIIDAIPEVLNSK